MEKIDQKNVAKIITGLNLFAETKILIWIIFKMLADIQSITDKPAAILMCDGHWLRLACNNVWQFATLFDGSPILTFHQQFTDLSPCLQLCSMAVQWLGFQLSFQFCSCLQHGSRLSLRLMCPCSFPFHRSKQRDESSHFPICAKLPMWKYLLRKVFVLVQRGDWPSEEHWIEKNTCVPVSDSHYLGRMASCSQARAY